MIREDAQLEKEYEKKGFKCLTEKEHKKQKESFNKDIDKFLFEMRKKYPNLRITESGTIGISKYKTIGTSMGEL
jgi:hypothetical protein